MVRPGRLASLLVVLALASAVLVTGGYLPTPVGESLGVLAAGGVALLAAAPTQWRPIAAALVLLGGSVASLVVASVGVAMAAPGLGRTSFGAWLLLVAVGGVLAWWVRRRGRSIVPAVSAHRPVPVVPVVPVAAMLLATAGAVLAVVIAMDGVRSAERSPVLQAWVLPAADDADATTFQVGLREAGGGEATCDVSIGGEPPAAGWSGIQLSSGQGWRGDLRLADVPLDTVTELEVRCDVAGGTERRVLRVGGPDA
jgi:hypothetical protein